MPQNGFNFEGRHDGGHHNTFKANHLLNGQIPARSLVNRSVFQHGRPGSESSTAGSLDRPKPAFTVNGYINHHFKNSKAAPPKTSRRQPNTCSAAGGVGGAGVLGGNIANGGTRRDVVNLCSESEQVVPDLSQSASEKNQRRQKRFRAMKKKRGSDITSSGSSALSPLLLHQMEDWDQEVKDSSLVTQSSLEHWKTMCFGVASYGPEDVFHLEFEGLTLQQGATAHQPVTANYSPAVHHAQPVRWRHSSISPEPDQFENSEL